jgi:hypothetical protein
MARSLKANRHDALRRIVRHPSPKEAAAALERRIAQLMVLADTHAAHGRPTSARDARVLILLLQDGLDDLHAGRWMAQI